MSDQYFSDRALGAYPLSIATSLAIESACGIHPEIKVSKPPILEYRELWINLRTLFRNFLGALVKQDADNISHEALAASLHQEMDQITSIIAGVSAGTKVVYYVSNHDGLERKYRHAFLRRDNTEKQKQYRSLEFTTLQGMLKENGHNGPIKGFALKLNPEHRPHAMILTHQAYDLVSAKFFSDLVLLESHTGKIKTRAHWHTKYLNGKDLVMIPFNEGLLQFFGDHEMFQPYPIKDRREVLEVAERYHWTAVTTREKLMFGIDKLKNPMLKAVLREMV